MPVSFTPRIRAVLATCLLAAALRAQPPARIDFARDIQPLFREHCIECHGPSQQMAGLRLDRRRDTMPNRVGANGTRIVAGRSADSPLYRRVSATEPTRRMPPTGPLPQEQIDRIRLWIDQGADWPDELSGERDAVPAHPAVLRIMTALRNGSQQDFTRALRDDPAAVNAKGTAGWTPLMYATLYGDTASLRLLLEKGARPNDQNQAGATALMYAVDDPDKTRLLLEHGANPNLRSGEAHTALLIAAQLNGSLPVVKLLLDKGADPSARLADGRGVLAAATFAHDPELLRFLVDRGVPRKPLALGVALLGCAPCFDLLLPLAEPGDLSSGLTTAIRLGDLDRIRLLLDRGARPSGNLLQTIAVAPPLPPDMVRALVALRGGIDQQTSAGLSMLAFAKRQGNQPLVQALTEAGAPDQGPALPALSPSPAASARAAVERSLPPLQRADVSFLQKAGCVSCHNNTLTAMTVAAARARGLKADAQVAQDQLRKTAAFLQENGERALENEGIPGASDTVSYILLGLAAGGYPSDPTTDLWARYLKNNQAADGRWVCIALRPPLESSDFAITAASIRSLRAYGLKSRRAEYDRAVERANRWLASAQPRHTEDYTFQILGLIWGGGSREVVRTAARALLARQNSDGGWSQTSALASDAYATGQALFALEQARALDPSAPAHRKGVQYLMNSQLADGSWRVLARAPAFQPHFDSDFPHGRDQFISAAATNWAALALTSVVR